MIYLVLHERKEQFLNQLFLLISYPLKERVHVVYGVGSKLAFLA